jgi:hypothetical protein
LYADTLKHTFYQVGGYIYHDYYVDNIKYFGDSLTFDICLERAEDLMYIVKSSLIFESDRTLLSISQDFINKLHDDLNPMFVGETKDRYLLNTIDTLDEINNLKLAYYQVQIERVEEELDNLHKQDTLYQRSIDSKKYLSHLIEMYLD